MGVFDGQPVNQAITNPAFINKNQDDVMPNKLGFSRTLSGTSIADIQAAVNKLYTATGASESQAGTVYDAPSNTIDNGDPYQTAFQKIADKFDPVTGHMHTGLPGDAPPVSAATVVGGTLIGFVVKTGPLTATGSSTDVSTAFSGSTPSTGVGVTGIVTTSPQNSVVISTTGGFQINDSSGDQVYGRLGCTGATWLLSFYSLIAGVETAYTFSAPTSIDLFYQSLQTAMPDTTMYSEEIDIGNLSKPLASTGAFGQTKLSSAAAQSVGSSNSSGTANGTVANSDHAHQGVHSIAVTGSSGLYSDVILQAGSNISLSQVGQNIQISATGLATGTVTSVGLSADSSVFSVTGSPVTTSGTLGLNLQTQSANKVWAGPTAGGAATPTFRSLVAADLPSSVNTAGSFVQAAATGAVTASVPANAQGFILMALDANTDNINWAIGSAAATGTGMQLQPGRDSGFIPCAANISICPKTGTQSYALQWILSS